MLADEGLVPWQSWWADVVKASLRTSAVLLRHSWSLRSSVVLLRHSWLDALGKASPVSLRHEFWFAASPQFLRSWTGQ